MDELRELTNEQVKARFREAESDLHRAAARLQEMATTLQALEGVRLELRDGISHLRETSSRVSDGAQAMRECTHAMRRAVELIERADIVHLSEQVRAINGVVRETAETTREGIIAMVRETSEATREGLAAIEKAQVQTSADVRQLGESMGWLRNLVLASLMVGVLALGLMAWQVSR